MPMPRILSAVVVCGASVALAPSLASAHGERQSRPRDAATYWIGVRCVELPEVARAQLDLPADQGVLVDDVVVGAPAQKAGLERFDVVVAIGGEPVADPQALADAVAKSDGQELNIDYRRGGKPQSLKVRPEQRPENILPNGRDEMERAMRRWLERPDRPMSLRFFHPGMVMPQGGPAAIALPEDMTVTIEKTGGQPAKVRVSRGEENWQVTEETLDRLPPEARAYVERAISAPFDPGVMPRPPRISEPAAENDRRELDKIRGQLEELRRKIGEIDELKRQIEKLRN